MRWFFAIATITAIIGWSTRAPATPLPSGVSESLTITDLAGNILVDQLTGLPATRSIVDDQKAGTLFDPDSPPEIEFVIASTGILFGSEAFFDPASPTLFNLPFAKDFVSAYPLSDNLTEIILQSVAIPSTDNGVCDANCIALTGEPQDITGGSGFLALELHPGGASSIQPPFRIILQAALTEVPEPTTMPLLGVGTAGLVRFGRSKRG